MIPVVWLTYHDDCHPRAMWDQAWLEELFDGDIWTTPSWPGFTHHESLDRLPTDARGAVVIIPGRFHANDTDYARLTRELGRLHWVLAVVTSDEESCFDHRRVTHERIAWWIMTPRDTRHDAGDAFYIGEGWGPDTRALYRDAPLPERPLEWTFSGQITHERRDQLAVALRRLEPESRCWLLETDRFAGGLDRSDYLWSLTDAKVVPCPSGPATQDSFRFYETLEAGGIPIADAYRPGEQGVHYWDLLYGAHRPFPTTGDWHHVGGLIGELVAGWPAKANQIGAWWAGYKRSVAHRLDRQVRTLADHPPAEHAGTAAITVLVTVSPIPSHPDTHILDETLATVRARLPEVEIIIGCDGVRPEQEHLRAAYEEHVRAIIWKAQHHWHNVLPVVFTEHHHQANMTRRLLEQVTTPCVLFVEHDTPLQDDIPFAELVSAIRTGTLNLIRLHHESRILDEHRYLMVDHQPIQIADVPVLRTVQWSQRPHVASTGYYRRILGEHFSSAARTMIEDRMHGVVIDAWRQHGMAGWEDHRLALYAPAGSMQRSNHLDGRAGDPKFDMDFGT